MPSSEPPGPSRGLTRTGWETRPTVWFWGGDGPVRSPVPRLRNRVELQLFFYAFQGDRRSERLVSYVDFCLHGKPVPSFQCP